MCPAYIATGVLVAGATSKGGLTASCYARGGDMLIGAYHYLDVVPKGCDADALDFTMAWVRHHDRYGDDYFADPMQPYVPPQGSDCSCRSGEGHS
jgi:hypothetical protein